MAVETVHEKDVNEVARKAQGTWQKYQKPVAIILAVIILAIAGWYAYSAWVLKPKEEQANDAIFKAQQYFAQDSFKLALSGDGSSKGFKYIAENYSGTQTGNLAKFYAGICYLRTGDFNNAVKYLKDFSTSAKQIQMMAYGALADAYSELGKNDDAINYYKKAGSTFEKDDANSAEYLFRAGLKLETLGKTNEALEIYKEIKQKFPQTEKGYQIDKYIYRLSIVPNDFSTK